MNSCVLCEGMWTAMELEDPLLPRPKHHPHCPSFSEPDASRTTRGCSPYAAASVVLVIHKPLLLVVTNRHFGGISLPGGKQEGNETPRAVAGRELQEETGLLTFPEDLFYVCEQRSAADPERSVSVFWARKVCGGLKCDEEGTNAYFTTFQELCLKSKFKDFYTKQWSDGIEMFSDTKLALNAY